LNGAVSKTVKGLRVLRGFESHPLRFTTPNPSLVRGMQLAREEGALAPNVCFAWKAHVCGRRGLNRSILLLHTNS
jgi:hypothetical protein